MATIQTNIKIEKGYFKNDGEVFKVVCENKDTIDGRSLNDNCLNFFKKTEVTAATNQEVVEAEI